jgi:hypothetical protein
MGHEHNKISPCPFRAFSLPGEMAHLLAFFLSLAAVLVSGDTDHEYASGKHASSKVPHTKVHSTGTNHHAGLSHVTVEADAGLHHAPAPHNLPPFASMDLDGDGLVTEAEYNLVIGGHLALPSQQRLMRRVDASSSKSVASSGHIAAGSQAHHRVSEPPAVPHTPHHAERASVSAPAVLVEEDAALLDDVMDKAMGHEHQEQEAEEEGDATTTAASPGTAEPGGTTAAAGGTTAEAGNGTNGSKSKSVAKWHLLRSSVPAVVLFSLILQGRQEA